MTVYPGSTAEFRVLEKADGSQVLQMRYVNQTQGYTGKWQDVPVVKENDTSISA
jgi:hypothetical protein